jgi:hypothetical protein
MLKSWREMRAEYVAQGSACTSMRTPLPIVRFCARAGPAAMKAQASRAWHA